MNERSAGSMSALIGKRPLQRFDCQYSNSFRKPGADGSLGVT
jgi:hypothetical protein